MTHEIISVSLKGKSGLLTCERSILKLIREKFSEKNPSYQMRRMVPRIYAVTPAGAFQVGMWSEIEHFIRSLAIPVKITISPEFQKLFNPGMDFTEIVKIQGFDYYDYQIDTLREFVEHGRGISLIGTGGGKALICGGLCASILHHNPKARILIVVPNVGLLNQLYHSFLSEFDIGCVTRWGDGNLPDLEENIMIANTQILTSNLALTLEIVENYDAVIVDEVHTINEKKNLISKVIHNIHTPHKFGMSGTLPDSLMGTWNVMGKIGPILYEKNSYALRSQETITEVEVRIIVCKHHPRPIFPRGDNPVDAYNAEMDYIINHKERNDVIVKIVGKLGGNTLIVVDRLQYIETLRDALGVTGKKIYIITGDTPTDERTAIQNLMEGEDGIICLAMSKCFSTGISIKNLHYAVFAYMGKGGVKTVQTIGRTVRKHPSKAKAVIFDIADNLVYSGNHLKKRVQIYKNQKIDFKILRIDL